MYGPTADKKLLQVLQVEGHEPVQKLLGPLRVAGQEHVEPVVAVQELAGFQQVAAEQADDGPVRALAQPLGALGQTLQAAVAVGQRSGRRFDLAPHVLGERRFELVQVVHFQIRPIALFKVQRPVGHLGQDAAAGRTHDPAAFLALRQRPSGHLAGRAVGQRPVGPVFVLQREPAPHFDRVHAEPLQHVLVHNRQLLHRIVDADRALRQSQRGSQLAIRDRCDARRAMTAQVDRDPVRLFVIQRCEHALARSHNASSFPQGSSTETRVILAARPGVGEDPGYLCPKFW